MVCFANTGIYDMRKGCNKSWCNCRRGRLCGVQGLCWEDAMSMTSINDPDRLASSSSSIRPALAPTTQSPKGYVGSFYRRHQPDRRAPFDAHDLMHRQQTNRLAKWRSTRSSSAGFHLKWLDSVLPPLLRLFSLFRALSIEMVDFFLLSPCSFCAWFLLDLSTRKVNFNRFNSLTIQVTAWSIMETLLFFF